MDYVGVIFGPDLVYRPIDGEWVGHPQESFDRVVSRGVTTGDFTSFVKSTYRVLLMLGLRGCYVYRTVGSTRDLLLSRVEFAGSRSSTSEVESRVSHNAR